ncbi:MAG: DUF4405 domain-containing protein [Microscillaceae bacterium]|jgi:hypothetical protein|nr:DUF4405 domain-containing protein [Microscillaceae bacterium]
MKSKNLISLSVAFAFFTLAITGILLYIKQKAHFIEITHTIFGLAFVGFAIFHIINNWSSLTSYTQSRATRGIQKEFWTVSILGILVLAGGLTEVLEPIAEAGKVFAAKRPPKVEKEMLNFEKISTRTDGQGAKIRLFVQKAQATEMPVMAIWVEDTAHKFVENLFVPAKVVVMPASEEARREAKERNDYPTAALKPTDLAEWQKIASDPKPNYEKTTPNNHFYLASQTTAKAGFFVKLLVKTSQASEIYETQIDNSKNQIFKLKATSGTLLDRVWLEFE